jgi:predicted MFS family arabinose efflux permease
VSWPPIFEPAGGKHHGARQAGSRRARIWAGRPAWTALRYSAWQALRHREFRRYFAGSLISNFGTWLQNTAQVLLAYQLTHSVLAIAVVTFAQFSGSLVLGPFAATVASHMSGKKMLICTQVASAALAAGMAWLEWTGHLSERVLIAGALGLGLAFTFALPVQTALVPRLASESDTEAAMTMNSVSYNAGRALAPALSVLVIVTIGFAPAFALNAASFAIFAAILTRIQPSPEEEPRQAAYARDGLVDALKRPRILLFLGMVAAVTFADDPILILGPAVAHTLPGASSDWAGYFLSALGFGTVLGSLRRTKNARRATASYSTRRAARSLLLLAVAIGVFAAGFSKWVSLLAAFVAGVAALRTGAVSQTQLVRQRPERIASVMALWAIAWAGTKPIASLLDGWLASAHGIKVAAGILISLAVVLAVSEILLTRLPAYQKESLKIRGRNAANWLVRHIEAGESVPEWPLADPSSPAGRGRDGKVSVGAQRRRREQEAW